MKILDNYSLKSLNSFGINATARHFITINKLKELTDVFNNSFIYEKFFVLGGGSNILFLSDYDGLIININIKGIKFIKENKEYVIVEFGAGEIWNDSVKYLLNNKLYGFENLAMIPGKVGAAPVQNIGAYGVEQKDLFYSLSGFNVLTKQMVKMNNDECEFAYRDSVFKNEMLDKIIITSVQYKFNKKYKPVVSYRDIQSELNLLKISDPTPQQIFDMVSNIRSKKLPDPNVFGNAGSFFKNPVINYEKYNKLRNVYYDLPSHKISTDEFKIPAGWLIEKSGWKGKRIGNTGVHEKHSLVLVNYGNASGEEILNLSINIQKSIYDKFGIFLEREVLLVN